MDYFFNSITHMFLLALVSYFLVYKMRYSYIQDLMDCTSVEAVVSLYQKERNYFKKGSSFFSNVYRLFYFAFCVVFPFIFVIPCFGRCDSGVYQLLIYLIYIAEAVIDFLFNQFEKHIYVGMITFNSLKTVNSIINEPTLSVEDKLLSVRKEIELDLGVKYGSSKKR